MSKKQEIEISQRITFHVSLPIVKVKLLKERHVSAGIPHKTPKALLSFECMVFLFCLIVSACIICQSNSPSPTESDSTKSQNIETHAQDANK